MKQKKRPSEIFMRIANENPYRMSALKRSLEQYFSTYSELNGQRFRPVSPSDQWRWVADGDGLDREVVGSWSAGEMVASLPKKGDYSPVLLENSREMLKMMREIRNNLNENSVLHYE